jgi:hypothetical protein
MIYYILGFFILLFIFKCITDRPLLIPQYIPFTIDSPTIESINKVQTNTTTEKLQNEFEQDVYNNLSALTKKNMKGGKPGVYNKLVNLFKPHVYKSLNDYETIINTTVDGDWNNSINIKDNLDLTPDVLTKKIYAENYPNSPVYNNKQNKPYYMKENIIYTPSNNPVVASNFDINEKPAEFNTDFVNLNNFFKANQNMFTKQHTYMPLVTDWKQNINYLNVPMISNKFT